MTSSSRRSWLRIGLGLASTGLLFAVAGTPSTQAAAAPPTQTESPGAEAEIPLTVASYNIHHGYPAGDSWEDPDDHPDLRGIGEMITRMDADVVLLQEISQFHEIGECADQLRQLAEMTGFQYHRMGAIKVRPAVACGNEPGELGGIAGNAILSRYPLTYIDNIPLPRDPAGNDVGVCGADTTKSQRCALQVVADVDGTPVTLYNTHLHHKNDDEGVDIRAAQISEILDKADTVGEPTVLGGDFNLTTDGANAPDLIAMADAGWMDTVNVAVGHEPCPVDDFGCTYRSDNPTKRIDYVFAGDEHLASIDLLDIEGSTASDHLPVVVQLELSG